MVRRYPIITASTKIKHDQTLQTQLDSTATGNIHFLSLHLPRYNTHQLTSQGKINHMTSLSHHPHSIQFHQNSPLLSFLSFRFTCILYLHITYHIASPNHKNKTPNPPNPPPNFPFPPFPPLPPHPAACPPCPHARTHAKSTCHASQSPGSE